MNISTCDYRQMFFITEAAVIDLIMQFHLLDYSVLILNYVHSNFPLLPFLESTSDSSIQVQVETEWSLIFVEVP